MSRPTFDTSLAVHAQRTPPTIVHDVLGSPGRQLEPAVRDRMEAHFGHDFSRVRVHSDTHACESARAVSARAYTVGSHVVVGAADRHILGTPSGTRLLAHELAHVRQQGGDASQPVASRLTILEDGSSLEREARVSADAVSGGVGGPRQTTRTSSQARVASPSGGGMLARTPDEDERAKAIAEAKAVAARIDQELADADKDDEPVKPTPRAGRTAARFLPGGFTDKEADVLAQEAQSRVKLGSMALTLAERQARRHEFWDSNPSYNSADVKEAFRLDLYWDPEQETFVRQKYVTQDEDVVRADPEAWRLYSDRLWDLTENKPEEKSRFKRAMDFVCAHTEPCSSNLEQFRKDRESGMSRDEALNRGMARLVTHAELMMAPGPGPSGPITVGPGVTPSGGPVSGPLPEGVGPGLGGGDTTTPSEPLMTTGGKAGKPPADVEASGQEEAVPGSIENEETNRIPKEQNVEEADVGEKVGDFRIFGEKGLKGDTFEREILGIKGPPKPMRTAQRGVGPLLRLFKFFTAEARAAGATKLRVVGGAIGNEGFLEMEPIVKKYGGTFRRIDETTVEMEIPLSGQTGDWNP